MDGDNWAGTRTATESEVEMRSKHVVLIVLALVLLSVGLVLAGTARAESWAGTGKQCYPYIHARGCALVGSGGLLALPGHPSGVSVYAGRRSHKLHAVLDVANTREAGCPQVGFDWRAWSAGYDKCNNTVYNFSPTWRYIWVVWYGSKDATLLPSMD